MGFSMQNMDDLKIPLAYLERLFNWMLNIDDWGSLKSWLARLLFFLFLVCMLLWLLRQVVEFFAKLVEAWCKLGLRIRTSPEEKTALRRRMQFCKVLEGDLATLAKSENWNDQWFTDLEAEVEIEGRYYERYWDRLVRKSTKGLRRIPALIKAIESSDEQFLFLVGEPGSGKSVALRHVASEFANRATKSRAKKVVIPLYINLKELPNRHITRLAHRDIP